MESTDTKTDEVATLSREEADNLVVEHMGWAQSIARSVARSWNLDWQLDGLDGAAMEALIFCARRFQPGRGVPFRGYARRRIHEAATEASRKSRGWKKGLGSLSSNDQKAREISAQLFDIFPELRDGDLPGAGDGGDSEGSMRSAIRELLVGASLLATKEGIAEGPSPEELVDYKKMIQAMGTLEMVHQLLLWKVYWEGMSLRSLASEWGTDGLNVIREHKTLLLYLNKSLALGKTSVQRPKIRPGLRPVSQEMKKSGEAAPFSKLLARVS